MLSKFNNKKHRRLTALLLCAALMLGSVTSVSADISAADSETEVQNYAEEPTTEAVSYGASEAQAEVQEETSVAEETEAPAADTQQTEAHTEAATEAHTETAAETQAAETTETATEKVWTAQVGNATVKVTGTEGALPEDAQLRVNEITAGNGKEEIENAVAEQMADNKEEASIQNVLAYDIKFIQNGQEVQPSMPVQVSVDSPEIASDEETAVYHVDDNNNVEDMDGNVDAEGNVVFEAPHFSTYVIINKGSSNITVTLQHYDHDSKKKLYSDEAVPLSTRSKINNYSKSGNYDVTEVYEITYDANGKEVQTKLDNIDSITAMKNTTYRIYYKPNTGTTTGDVTLWDYDKIDDDEKGINRNDHYKDKTGKTPRLTMGTNRSNGLGYNSAIGTNKLNANNCNYGTDTGGKGTLGLVTGLSEDYSTVLWSCDQPGFFTKDNTGTKHGKTIYENYDLEFSRTGNSYTLANVITPDGEKKHSGSGFWPFGDKEYYFGMRYDVTFTLGDYVGDLNYKFKGDDDLWVLLDGKKVVIDVGGIHDALEGSTDLWEDLGYKNGARPTTTAEKNKEHRITVLYMERGAGESNCEMEFTLPNARLLNVENTPIAQISFVKLNTKNEALKDATFVLKNDETGEDQEVKSDENGNVLFSNLVAGRYTLTEKVAPNGYAASNTPWKVFVTVEGTTATAKLYESDGTKEVAQTDNGTYKIINLSQEEQAKLLVDYDKTAKVTDWENRKYDIDITASSKLTTSTTQESGGVADVMLVLDTSGSMGEKLDEYLYVGANDSTTRSRMDTNKTYYLKNNDHYYKVSYSWYGGWRVSGQGNLEDLKGDIYIHPTRLDALKSAATQFITDTATTSPTSNVGISVFSSSGYGNHGENKPLAAVGANKDTLISFINDLSANGGTDPAVGLQDAYDKLKAASDGGDTLPKYVILFTDGEPTGGGNSWNTTAQTNAESKAKALKEEMGVKVYTIGFALNDKTKTFLAGGKYDGKTYPGIASPGCAMVADDASKLAEIFKTIQSTITQNCDINSAIVVDAIDSRFVILDDDGKQITKKYLEDKKVSSVTLNNGGTVYYDDNGVQYIKWTGQTIKHKKGDTQGWSKTISVQAKDDYIGGNNVPTNISPNSKIITSYGELTLPKPKVNVKAELTLKDKEITIYKGDSVPSAKTVLEEMVDKYTDNVNKYSVSENQFDAKWYTADALKDNKENFNDNTATTSDVVGTAVINNTTYYLKVTYDAGAPTDESNKNTTLKVNDKDTVYSVGDDTTHKVEAVKEATDTTPKRTYGIYQIDVISGEIQIVKKLETPAKKDQTFTFVVKNAEDDNEMAREVARVLVTVKANEKEATVTDEAALATLTNLSRGTYTVEEVEQTGYMLDSAVSDDTATNCQNSTDNAKVTFVLGYNSVSPNENVIQNYSYDAAKGGRLGKAIFTNEPVYSNWQIIKVSASSHERRLAGAIFELSTADVTYYGKSGEAGIVEWYRNYQKDTGEVSDKIEIPDKLSEGTYTLKEIKAPTGYVLSTNTYTLQITKTGALKAVHMNGTEMTPELQENGDYHILIENTVIYNLPNSGGSGIYWFSICGMLLMMAAAWIIYKNKCREVLVK